MLIGTVENRNKTTEKKKRLNRCLEILKVHYCRFENLPISLSSYENYMLKVSH